MYTLTTIQVHLGRPGKTLRDETEHVENTAKASIVYTALQLDLWPRDLVSERNLVMMEKYMYIMMREQEDIGNWAYLGEIDKA